MKISKYYIIIVYLFMEISMLWSLGRSLYVNPNMEKIEKEKAEKILEAIKNKDVISFQKLFAPDIEAISPTYNEDVKTLFENFKIQNYEVVEVTIYESERCRYGDVIVKWNVFCKIKLDEAHYHLSFIDIRKNSKNKINTGVYSLELIDSETSQKLRIKFDDMEAGVFNLERYMKKHNQ